MRLGLDFFGVELNRLVGGVRSFVWVGVLVLGVVLFVPSPALSASTRPFLRQITGTPTGVGGALVPFYELGREDLKGPDGVAVGVSGDLWVAQSGRAAEGQPSFDQFSEFDSSGVFIGPEPGPAPLRLQGGTGLPSLALGATDPGSLAIEDSTGDFFVTGGGSDGGYNPHVEVFGATGKLLKQWELLGGPGHVAVDNSCSLHTPVLTALTKPSCKEFDPSNDSVYVSSSGRVSKFNVGAAGEPAPALFTGSAGYIEGGQIVGAPEGSFGGAEPTPGAVTVDSQGNIYVVGLINNGNQEVYEYDPQGEFVRRFAGSETPGVGESTERGGWGGRLQGIAVDSVSGHLLVSVHHENVEHGVVKGEGAIDEFDIATGKYFGQITATEVEAKPGVHVPGHLHDPKEIAVDSQGNLYVADSTTSGEENEPVHVVDEYGPLTAHAPSVKIGEAGELTSEDATVHGSIDPNGQPLGTCQFQYVTESEFQGNGFSGSRTAECEPSASAISKEADLETYYSVRARLTGLSSGVTYRYRLVATTLGAGEAVSEAHAFTAPDTPRIESVSVASVSSTFAELGAVIDPLGADTTYHFEYDTSPYTSGEAHGVSIPVPDVDVGSGGPAGDTSASVTQQINGLEPGRTYYFRVIARNEVGVAQGAGNGQSEGTFMTMQASVPGLLPDGRAYEMVTPPNKSSAEDMFAHIDTVPGEYANSDRGYPAESGNGFLLETTASFSTEAHPFAASGNNAYVLKRGMDGWETIPLASPSLGVQGLFASVFEPESLARVGVEDRVGSDSSEEGLQAESLVGGPGGPYTTLRIDSPVSAGGVGQAGTETEIVGASHDLDHVVLESTNHTLASGAEGLDPYSEALYEWTSGNSECKSGTSNCTLVNVQSNGELVSKCGASLGQGNFPGGSHNAVSENGSEVFFTAPDPEMGVGTSRQGNHTGGEGCWDANTNENPPELYARSGGVTTEVSAPVAGVSESGHVPVAYPAIYVGASEDGSKVFFLSDGWLTEDHPAGHNLELYEYDTLTGALTRASAGEEDSPAMSGGADVNFVPAISANGSAVYFAAYGKLTADATTPGGGGRIDLYRYDTVTHTTTFVTVVNEFDYPSDENTSAYTGGASELALDPEANWYTTPDGDFLVFSSVVSVTGFDNGAAPSGHCPLQNNGGGVSSGGACAEVYRFHYEPGAVSGGSLVCVSCDSSGARPVSNAFFGHSTGNNKERAAGPVRAISNDGSYVFFDSGDPLVSYDNNGTLDVYEWEAQGTGGCELPVGCVHLISSGEDPAPSFFLGASPDGHNVFFGTHAKLVSQDTDTAGDVYDARVCEPSSGNPCFGAPLGETAQCEADACQNASPLSSAPTPATFTLASSGNVHSKTSAPVKHKKAKPKKRKAKKRKTRAKAKARHAKKSGRASK